MNSTKAMVMITDDNITNLQIGKNVLSGSYDVITVPSAEKMFERLEHNKPDLILLDIEMPVMSGFEAIKILKSRPDTHEIPVIFLTGKRDLDSELEGLSLGAIDFILKPFVPPLLCKRIEVHLAVVEQKSMLEKQAHTLEDQARELKAFNDNLQRMVKEKTGKVLELQGAILRTIAGLVENRDNIKNGQIGHMHRGILILLSAIQDAGLFKGQMSDWDSEILLQSSQLHDIGKIAISDSLISKPGKLTMDEFEEMKEHAMLGVKIIEKIEESAAGSDFINHAKVFAAAHHEKWDGTGYPNGLRGDEIPLEGRLMAIIDVYDALVSERPYKKALTHDEAVRIIIEGKGSHFDPALVDVFEKVADRFVLQ